MSTATVNAPAKTTEKKTAASAAPAPSNATPTPQPEKVLTALERLQKARQEAAELEELVKKEAKEAEEKEAAKWDAVNTAMLAMPKTLVPLGVELPANEAEHFAFFAQLVARLNTRKTARPVATVGSHDRTGRSQVSSTERDERNAKIIELSREGKMTIAEIASQMGVSTALVNVIRANAKRDGLLD